MNYILYTFVFWVLTIVQIQSSDILVIFPTTAQSHFRVIRPLIYSLLDRGHKILAITNFPDVNERVNLSYINIAGLKPHSKVKVSEGDSLINSFSRAIENVDTYSTILNHPPIVKLLKSERKFDLVIVEFFLTTPLFVPIANIVNAPIIGFCPMITFPWIHEIMGVETEMSYMTHIFNSFTDQMSYFQRLENLLSTVLIDQVIKWFTTPKIRKNNKHNYGIQTESLIKSMANVSMIFTNNYPSMFMALPRVPGIVEVGGIHVVDEKSLSQDLNDFINDADHGVILFSLGSVVSSSSLSIDKLDGIFETFSKLKQKVIMKLDGIESYKRQLSNVKVVKWFPQRDLLAHPKVLLFISHAGMMSVIESIHCGKPMVAIPIFGDQPLNAKFLVEKEVAVFIDFKHLNGELLFNAINKTLTDNYRNNAIKLQQLYNDRPQSPLETAIYWTEYIIRNKDVSRELLKSPLIHLNFYQIYLIEVFTTLVLLMITAMCFILWKIKYL